MKNILSFINICIFTLLVFNSNAQQFLNGDLEGTISGISTLPPNWQNVPFTDVNSLGNCTVCETPDLTGQTGPDVSLGVIGNPYLGTTFLSGLCGDLQGSFFHEGIMQNVYDLEIGQTYTISFYQSVIKQVNALDGSGSWAIYIDSVLAGITLPTYSNAPFDANSFNWELRNIVFTSTETSHLIKFLPVDDDANADLSYFDINGGVRMGIDAINMDGINAVAQNNNLIISNVFTPNNDGLNDAFKIIIPNAATFNCKIYNRWGILVYEQTTINEAWDGNTTSGLPCTDGIYYWIAEYTDLNQKNAMKGFMQLLR